MPRLTGRTKSLVMASAAASAFVATVFLTLQPSGQPLAVKTVQRMATTSTVAPIATTTTTLAPPVPTTAPPAPATTVVTAAVPATPRVTAAPRVAAASTPALSLQERGELALGLISFPVAATRYTMVFAGHLDGILGITDNSNRTITIYIRNGQSTSSIARVIAHEIGHAVDFGLLTWAKRAEYMSIRGLTADSWYPCNLCEDYASPAGDFAEVFAYWQLGPGDFRSMMSGEPSPEQLAALVHILSP